MKTKKKKKKKFWYDFKKYFAFEQYGSNNG